MDSDGYHTAVLQIGKQHYYSRTNCGE